MDPPSAAAIVYDLAVIGVPFLAVAPFSSALEAMGIARLTEDAMAVLGPLVLYLVAVPVSGVLRYVRHLRARRSHASSSSPGTPQT